MVTYTYNPNDLPVTASLLNGHGDVVALTDISGTVIDSYTYDLWGKPGNSVEAVPQRLRYAGYWYDQELGLYWVSVREYSPTLMRWLQPDPSQQDGVRTYAYAGDDPVDGTDPTGLSSGQPPQPPLPRAPNRVAEPHEVFYRGADDLNHLWDLKPSEEQQIAKGSTNYGESVFNQVKYMTRFKYTVRIRAGDLPRSLRIQQRGQNLDHYEIKPNRPTTPEAYKAELDKIPAPVVETNNSAEEDTAPPPDEGGGSGGGDVGGGGGVLGPIPREDSLPV